MQKLLTFFFSKNIIVYAIFSDQSFNDMLVLNDWALIAIKPFVLFHHSVCGYMRL